MSRAGLKKLLLGGAALLVGTPILGAVGAPGFDRLSGNRRYAAPPTEHRAIDDSAYVARGRYLAYGPANCASCHSLADGYEATNVGSEPPLAGGRRIKLPLGTVYVPNITTDSATGIGGLSDQQLVGILRHNIARDGKALLPFMEFQRLADDDLVAILSFLRSQEPYSNKVPKHDLNLLARIALPLIFKPKSPPDDLMRNPPSGATVANGDYLVNAVSRCIDCHTQRNLVTGAYTGPHLAGGTVMPDDYDRDLFYVTPNLTPDSQTGRITGWSEDLFVARLKGGRTFRSSHMPWESISQMSDADMRAMYRYLRTITPVHRDNGAPLQSKRANKRK